MPNTKQCRALVTGYTRTTADYRAKHGRLSKWSRRCRRQVSAGEFCYQHQDRRVGEVDAER